MKELFSILVLVTIFSCNSVKSERPSNIPIEAIWIGGSDGGCWILTKTITSNSIEATIFHENGEVWENGVFQKIDSCEIDKNKIIEEITAFDGERLITNIDCSFKKIK